MDNQKKPRNLGIVRLLTKQPQYGINFYTQMSLFKKSIILAGDILMLYGSLIITLILRYGSNQFQQVFSAHINPFSVIFLVWIIVFYVSDLYENEFIRIKYPTVQKFLFAIFVNVFVSITLFYLFTSFFELTPKTNLFLFAAIFGLLDLGWRFTASKVYISGGLRNRIFVIGDSTTTNEILSYLKNNPQLGYDIISHVKDFSEIKDINKLCLDNHINTVIIQPRIKKDFETAKTIYKLLASKISVMDSTVFYEYLFQKLAFEELEESWFIEKIVPYRPVYEFIKRIIDAILSILLIIILSPLMILIAILIKLASKGPVIYKQERIGLNNKLFTLYKFRSMVVNHSGPAFTTKNDNRITAVGKIIRYTHLDEIPQLLNILKGNISFIGPRAEASKLVENYKQLPYYDLRHIIKPGLTGWAQVNYKPSASLEEAKEKLRYDIYYIKNRSFALDFFILLKTVRYLFISLK